MKVKIICKEKGTALTVELYEIELTVDMEGSLNVPRILIAIQTAKEIITEIIAGLE